MAECYWCSYLHILHKCILYNQYFYKSGYDLLTCIYVLRLQLLFDKSHRNPHKGLIQDHLVYKLLLWFQFHRNRDREQEYSFFFQADRIRYIGICHIQVLHNSALQFQDNEIRVRVLQVEL